MFPSRRLKKTAAVKEGGEDDGDNGDIDDKSINPRADDDEGGEGEKPNRRRDNHE